MVRNREIEEVVEMPCPCNDNDIVNNLKDQIEKDIIPRLQSLNIFDTQNVFVYCLYVEKNDQGQKNINIYQVYGSPVVPGAGIYLVVGDFEKMGCNSNIIYIGSSGNLNNRIDNLIRSLDGFIKSPQQDTTQHTTQQDTPHSGARCIKDILLEGCLFIVGFPIQTQISVQIVGQTFKAQLKLIGILGECMAKIAEACFLQTYNFHYKGLPRCVSRAPSCYDDYYTLLNSSNPQEAQEDIINILQAINSTFKNCIRDCSPL